MVGGSRRVASQRASIRITASFASSAGWPNRCPPIAIHDLLPAAVPAPVPINSVSTSRNRAIPYTYGVAHSSMRGEVRKVIPPTMAPRPSHRSCRCQIVATNVGTSVWPAEYSVASPYSARAPTETTSALSSWRTRDSTVGFRWRRSLGRSDGRDLRKAELERRTVREQHGNLERRRRHRNPTVLSRVRQLDKALVV